MLDRRIREEIAPGRIQLIAAPRVVPPFHPPSCGLFPFGFSWQPHLAAQHGRQPLAVSQRVAVPYEDDRMASVAGWRTAFGPHVGRGKLAEQTIAAARRDQG